MSLNLKLFSQIKYAQDNNATPVGASELCDVVDCIHLAQDWHCFNGHLMKLCVKHEQQVKNINIDIN